MTESASRSEPRGRTWRIESRKEGDNAMGIAGADELGVGMSTFDPGGRDAVRERVMQRLRAGIRERQMRGESTDEIYAWIDHQRIGEAITEEEATVAELVIRHYTTPDVRPYQANTRGHPGV
jgi:hypothetical protein